MASGVTLGVLHLHESKQALIGGAVFRGGGDKQHLLLPKSRDDLYTRTRIRKYCREENRLQ